MATTNHRNKELQLFTDNINGSSPFVIDVVNELKVDIDVQSDKSVGDSRTKTLQILCNDLILRKNHTESERVSGDPVDNTQDNKAFSVRDSLFNIQKDNTTDYRSLFAVSLRTELPIQKLTLSDVISINEGVMKADSKFTTSNNQIYADITGPKVANSQLSDSAALNGVVAWTGSQQWYRISEAVVEEHERAVGVEHSIVLAKTHTTGDGFPQLSEPTTENPVWTWTYNQNATYNNINSAYLNSVLLAKADANTIVGGRTGPAAIDSTDNVSGKYTEVGATTEFAYRNINDAMKYETTNRIKADNLMKSKKTTKSDRITPVELRNSAPNETAVLEETSMGNWDNFNDAFAFENHRAVRRQHLLSKSHSESTVPEKLFNTNSDYSTSTVTANGNTVVEYNSLDTLEVDNYNKGILMEHRRAVKVENEVNKKIEALLAGADPNNHVTLSDIAQLFNTGDLKLSANLQEFSKRYNALVGDFNTLSESHKRMLDRFNTTFESADESGDLVYSQATRSAIRFNVSTGQVNATLALTDDNPASEWDRKDVSEPNGGVYIVSSSQEPYKELCIPLTNIFDGATLIVRRVDSNGQNKPIRVKWAEDSDTGYYDYFLLDSNKAEIVLLGSAIGWVPLKPAEARRVQGNSSTWVVGSGGVITNAATIVPSRNTTA